MERALIIIDYTNDFVADEGKLTCGRPAQEIAKTICNLTTDFLAENQFVVVANDIHYPEDSYHPENKLFPTHNQANSTGRKPYGKLADILTENQGHPNLHLMDKTRYSAFAGTDLEIRLRERNIKELHLVGVCTDICVLHTAVDGYNKGFSLNVHADGVQSFNPTGHNWALTHFRGTLGANIYLGGAPLSDSEFEQYLETVKD